MKRIPIVMLVQAWALVESGAAACIAVPSDRILARDLAPSVALFQALDPETVLGYAPWPGTQRVLTSHDLVLAARSAGLLLPGSPLPSVCIERLVRALSIDDVRAALLEALAIQDHPEIHLEVLGFTNKPLPPGRLVFQLAALNHPAGDNAQTPVVWPGRLIYDERNSLSVWAKVRITVPGEVFVARQNIAPGEVLRAEQIQSTHAAEFPSFSAPHAAAGTVIGKLARRPIRAGQRITAEMLENPRDVRQGETVHVKVIQGAATITLDAVAQSSGTRGDSILVHNPASGKSFRAVIEDRSQVLVVPAPDAARRSPPEPAPVASAQ